MDDVAICEGEQVELVACIGRTGQLEHRRNGGFAVINNKLYRNCCQ
jgi:hypothetical protein